MRLAVVCDFLEEDWPSMDLVADMLVSEWERREQIGVRVTKLRPAMPAIARRLPRYGASRIALNVDRLAGRWWKYPRLLRRLSSKHDFFHVADHSYAHLVSVLPRPRTGVYCHDIDAFRCLIDPGQRRPVWFRQMAARILDGLRQASVVFYSTSAVRSMIEAHRIVDPRVLVYAPYGVAPEFNPDQSSSSAAVSLLAPLNGNPFVLHVGSSIPRKRIDILIEVFATLRRLHPEYWLVQVGGTWTPAQLAQLERARVADRVLQLKGLTRNELAGIYARAGLVFLPSAAEGFGLPVIEALACAAPVVATDIPPFREVGGDAALYCPVGDPNAAVEVVLTALSREGEPGWRERRLARAQQFSWAAHADAILQGYVNLGAMRSA